MHLVCLNIRLEMCVLCVSERGFRGQRQAEIGEERYQHRKGQGDKVCVLLPLKSAGFLPAAPPPNHHLQKPS